MNLKKIKQKYYLKAKKTEKKILNNIFKTKYDKNVLICYIIAPFANSNLKIAHTNIEMARLIAQVFSRHGYNVDVVNFYEEKEIKLQKYNVVFGWGANFDNASKEKGICTIAFLTGASTYFANLAELERVKEAIKRTGKQFKLRRQAIGLINLETAMNTDAAICHGNAWTLSTWSEIYENIYPIDGFGFNTGGFIKRNVRQTNKNFLFISGSGNIHKGLDLCLEAFRDLPNHCLYIATKLDKDFEEHYREDLKRENVNYLGFISVDTDEYREIAKKCLFTILISCAEGMATSVLTSMDSGMIPIVTRQCGIDIDETGFLIDDISINKIRDTIQRASSYDVEKLFIMSVKSTELVKKRYNAKVFEKRLDEILTEIEK